LGSAIAIIVVTVPSIAGPQSGGRGHLVLQLGPTRSLSPARSWLVLSQCSRAGDSSRSGGAHKHHNRAYNPWSQRFDRIFRNEEVADTNPASSTLLLVSVGEILRRSLRGRRSVDTSATGAPQEIRKEAFLTQRKVEISAPLEHQLQLGRTPNRTPSRTRWAIRCAVAFSRVSADW
jgi:hypothetical protein